LHGGLHAADTRLHFPAAHHHLFARELNSGMPTAGINLLWLLIAVIVD